MVELSYMANVSTFKAKVFKSKIGMESWVEVINILKENGIDILTESEETDVSIVLSGAWENAGILQGKRILFYDIKDWMEKEPDRLEPYKFELYRPILEEYYDEFINLSDMSNKGKANEILAKIKEIKNESKKTNRIA